MRWFGLFILLIICSSAISAQSNVLSKERLMLYLGCEIFDGACTLSFEDYNKKQLKILILLPADKLNFEYDDFVISNSKTDESYVNLDSIRKEFRVQFDESGQVMGIIPVESDSFSSKNQN